MYKGRNVPSHEAAIQHGSSPAEVEPARKSRFLCGNSRTYAVVHDAPNAHELKGQLAGNS